PSVWVFEYRTLTHRPLSFVVVPSLTVDVGVPMLSHTPPPSSGYLQNRVLRVMLTPESGFAIYPAPSSSGETLINHLRFHFHLGITSIAFDRLFPSTVSRPI
ncbi:hypothetical protein U1Q18_042272, partial [Sarracenia purpurea var. burkii]